LGQGAKHIELAVSGADALDCVATPAPPFLPKRVGLNGCGTLGASVTLDVETLVRAYLALQKMRDEAGDERECCIDHGFWDPRDDTQCPGCVAESLARDAAARLSSAKESP
jgi:hypothetical protein